MTNAQREQNTRLTRVYVALEGFSAEEAWVFTFDTPRALCRFLRKLGKGQLKRARISRIFSIEEQTS